MFCKVYEHKVHKRETSRVTFAFLEHFVCPEILSICIVHPIPRKTEAICRT